MASKKSDTFTKRQTRQKSVMNQFFESKKVLVTGGAGFIGTNLLLKLLEKGATVRATIHKKPSQIKDLKVEFVKADLTKPADCKRVVRGIDHVFMCAANTSGAAVIEKTPLAHVTPNVIMNSLMLEAAHKANVKKFLFISSNTVYPLTDYAVDEDDVNYTLYEKYFPVGWMKLFTEKMCEMYSTKIKNPMTTIVVRPGNIYGPYDHFDLESSHVIPALIKKVIEKQTPLAVWGDGKDIKDFIYAEDLVDGLLLAMEKINTFDPVNIASGKPTAIRYVLQTILRVENYKNPKIVFNSLKPTMIPIRLINIDKAGNILGFSPKTSIEIGIKKT